MIPSRRSFFVGASAFLAAPSIVRVASLMPVSVVKPTLLLSDPMGQTGYCSTSWWHVVMAENKWQLVAIDKAGRSLFVTPSRDALSQQA